MAMNSPLGADALLVRDFHMREQLGRMFQIDLDLLSEKMTLEFDKAVGHNATVRVELPHGKTRYFNGFISRFAHTGMHGRFASYRATLVPWLWFLTRTADCRIFQEMKVPDIIEQVFRDHGFTHFELSLSGNYPKWVYCVQYRETDFNFVSRLMEQEGIYYFFKHENGKHTLVLADAKSAHKPWPGYENIVYRSTSKGAQEEEHIHDWSVEQEVHPGSYALNDFNFEKPKASLLAKAQIPRAHAMAKFEVYDYPGEYDEQGDGEDHYARIRIQELQAQHEIVRGQANARGLAVGNLFKLKEYPRKDQNREYLVTSASYHLTGDDFETGTGQSGGEFFTCNFTAMPTDGPFRPARITPKPHVQGPQTAIVVGPSGEEIHTNEHGQVKLQFHWDRYGKADENSSCWVRVSQEWAGKKWGAIYLPRIGQEVIVEFLEGDPDQPIVTGRVYNGDAKPPYDLPAEKTKSTLKSNSSKGGNGFNEIRFEDKKDGEQIFIHAQRNMDVRVRNNLQETVYGNREIRVGWEKDGASGGSLNTLVKLDANTHIKGGQYEQIEKDLNQTVGGAVIESFKKDQTTKVDATRTLNAKEVVVEAGDAISQKTAKMAIEGSQEVGVKGGAVNVESSQGISLKCGGNFLTIDPSGVSINGSMVKINSGGCAQPAAAAKSAEVPEMETPFDAVVADDGKTGQKLSTGPGKPRQRGKVKLMPIKAPPYKPPPGPDGFQCGPVPPVPVSSKPCGIGELDVTCSHKRKPGPNQILQVVPDTEATDKIEKAWGPVTVTLTKKYKGKDEVTAKVESKEPGASGRKQLACLDTASSPSESEWKSKSEDKYPMLPAGPDDDMWPINAAPKIHHVFGRGCDDVFQTVTIESYPSQQYSVELSTKFFEDWVKTVNKGWEEWGDKIMGVSPVELKPKLTGPKGKASLSWGWKEDKDWRAYFEIAADIGLDPILGVGIEVEVSLVKVAGASAGIPPCITDLAHEHLADIFVTGGAEVKGCFTGGPRGRFYATGEERIIGEATLSIEGKLSLKLTGRVGSDYIASASVNVGGETKITGKAKAELERKGLFVQPSVVLKPLKVEVVINLKAFKIFSREEKIGKWTPWEDVDLWKGEKQQLAGSK
jgi:type VI secretion system secreted protein VgrG